MHFHPSDNHIQRVHGRIFVLRLCIVRVWASSLCSGCGRKCTLSVRRLYVCAVRVWAPALCSGCGQKCTRTVLRLCAVCVWVPALCSGCGQKVHPHRAETVFFSFFFSCRPHATPPLPAQSTRNKKEARPKYCRPPHSTVALPRVCFYAEHGGSRSSWKENLAIVPSIAEKVRRNNRSVCARECEVSA